MRISINGKKDVDLSVPRVMGILNLTPDSFSDSGRFEGKSAAEHVFRMIDDGADMIDIGGESTRPGSLGISVEEEIGRIIPFIREYSKSIQVPISVDTTKAEVAEAALDAGADMINDVSGLGSEEMTELIASADVPVVIMHMHGSPSTMQNDPIDDIDTVRDFLRQRSAFAEEHGIRQMILDPGIGFGKTVSLNNRIVDSASSFSFGHPVLIGASRKTFLAETYPGMDRDEATAEVSARAIKSGANILRVHDVKSTVAAIRKAL